MRRPGGHLPIAAVKRVQEAANSWLLLNAIYQQFGPSPDGAVERDMLDAENRLRRSVIGLQQPLDEPDDHQTRPDSGRRGGWKREKQ